MKQEILHHQLDNGLTIVAEPMPWLESVAFSMSVPSGCQYDPHDRLGLANFTCEMVQRGCGQRDSRRFIEDLEFLGVDYSSSVSSVHTYFSAAMPSESLSGALPIFGDLLQQPHLPLDQLEDGRRVCYQELLALEDDLPQQVMLELRRLRYPDPLGRASTGKLESIQAIDLEDVQQFFERYYSPRETILSFAGRLDWDRLVEQVSEQFAGWAPKESDELPITPAPYGASHIPHDSAQTHIGLAYESVPYAHPDYFLARGAVGVLSDGMSSRLFTEVREKRGLCYSVYSSYHSLRDYGSVVSYAGTSTDRAQETLNVLVDELFRLGEGITESELDRLKVQIRSNLVMQQESSRSRAGSIGGDWYHLGRARTLDELNQIIQQLTTKQINTYLESHPPQHFTLVTLGAEVLEKPVAISKSIAG